MSLIYVVVPCHKPRNLIWALSCFQRQLHIEKKLIVVENGAAIGACKKLGIPADLIVTSDAHQSHARNAGVDAVRSLGGGRIAMFDSDDWYGKNYLTELNDLFDTGKATVYGKHRHFTYVQNRGLYLFADRWTNSYADVIHGPSLAFHSDDAVPFVVQKEAEEYRFCCDIRDKGGKVWASSFFNLCYIRSSNSNDHTWVIGDDIVEKSFSLGCNAYWFGETCDFDIVDGDEPWEPRVVSVCPNMASMPINFSCGKIPLSIISGQQINAGNEAISFVMNGLKRTDLSQVVNKINYT